jgi:TolB-like protein/tetratricopeptide (TPR) repeat protein
MPSRAALTGWKSIARHFGHDIRTAQRWVRDRGMPVHRVPGGEGGRVFAYADELDRWLHARTTGGAPRGLPATTAARAGLDGARVPQGLLVLPFEYVAADPDLRFVAAALSEELIGRLATAKLAHTRVLSAVTGRAFGEMPAFARSISADLGVRYLVEGAVRAAGRQWRIDIRVVDAERDEVLFTDRFACDGREILLLQSQVAQSVCRQLALELAGDPVDCEWTREVDPAAFLCHLEGAEHARHWTLSGWRSALERFDEALRIDPSYAPARAAAGCVALNMLVHAPNQSQVLDTLARRHRNALGDAYGGMSTGATLAAKLALHDWNWSSMEATLAQRIRTVPSSVDPRGLINIAYVMQQRFGEAQAVLAPVAALEASADVAAWHGRTLIWARRFDDAAACFDQALARRPGHAYAGFMRFMAAFYAGDLDAAADVRRRFPREQLAPYASLFDGLLAARRGDIAAGRRHRASLAAKARAGRAWWYHVARVSAALGDCERTMAELGESMRRHEPHATLAGVDPLFDGLRERTDFGAALRTMSLPA